MLDESLVRRLAISFARRHAITEDDALTVAMTANWTLSQKPNMPSSEESQALWITAIWRTMISFVRADCKDRRRMSQLTTDVACSDGFDLFELSDEELREVDLYLRGDIKWPSKSRILSELLKRLTTSRKD